MLEEIRKYVANNSIDLTVFCGDLFESRGRVHVQTFNETRTAIEMLAQEATLIMVTGNHDQANREGDVHALESFRDFCIVVDEPEWVDLNGATLLAVPYCDDAEKVQEALALPCPKQRAENIPAICVMHHGLDGAKYGDLEFVVRDPVKLDALDPKRFMFTAVGHYHYPQELAPNVAYVGATHQHTWGDVGQDRGVIILDTDTGDWKRVTIGGAPRFLVADWPGGRRQFPWPYSNAEGNFVRVRVPAGTSESKVASFRKSLEKAGARWIGFETVGGEVARETRLETTNQSLEDMGEAYIRGGFQAAGEADEDLLVQMFRERMRAARDEIARRV